MPSKSGMSAKEDAGWRPVALAVFTLALGLRVAYLRQFADLPFFDQPVGDSAIYLSRAREIASGIWLPTQPFFFGSVLYPYFLALILGLARGSIFAVAVVQVVAGSVLATALAGVSRRVYGMAAGVATGILAALYGPLSFMEADVLGVIWGLLALIGGIYLCHVWLSGERSGASRPMLTLLAVGAAFGLSATERPNLVLLIPLVSAWCAWVARTSKLRAGVSVLAGAAVPVSLYLILNVAGTGQWIPLTTSTGINMSIGYHAGADGTFREPWEGEAPEFAATHTEPCEASRKMASIRVGRELDAREASRYWEDQAIQFVRTHPLDALRLTLRKAALMVNDVEVPNHLDFVFIRRQAPALMLMPMSFGVVFVLGLIGLVACILERRGLAEVGLLALLSVGVLVSVLPFFVADRYRIPLVPPLLIASGPGAVTLGSILRGRSPGGRNGFLAIVSVAACAVALALLPLARPIEGRDYWMLAQAYEAKGALPEAVRAYEAAVRADSTNATVLNNLGGAYRKAQQRSLAAAAFRKAIAINPALVLPHKNLGMTLITVGDHDGALAELREAERLSSGDAQTLGAIGALLAERGDIAGSVDAFSRALRLAPSDRSLRGLLGSYPQVAERISEVRASRDTPN